MAKTEKIKKPLYKRWQFWTITAVVAVVIALVLATTLDYTILSACIRLACKPKDASEPNNYADILDSTEVIYDISYESSEENGYLDIYSPKNARETQPLVVYIHGGYYIGGGKEASEPYCRTIAAEGYIVASIDYALAPEAKFPKQLKQADEAVKFLVDNAVKYKIDKEQIFIGGDSAGAHLSSVMGAFYTNLEMAGKFNFKPSVSADSIKGLLLLCGFYNMDTVGDCKFPFFDTAMWALTDVRNYKKYVRVNEMSTVKQVTRKYPAAFVTCGGDDPFYSQAEELIEVFKEKGVDYIAYLPKSNNNKLKHEFQRDFNLEESYEAMRQTVKFLKDRSKLSQNEEIKTREITATFALDTGDTFVAKLCPEYAPKTVENFIKYAEAGFYNGTVFHRVLSDLIIQGGGYEMSDGGMKQKTPLFAPIEGEFKSNGFSQNTLKHTAGVLSMARTSNKNSATSQFFVCAADYPSWDGEYAAFGIVTEGLDAVKNLTRVTTDINDAPLEPITLLSVVISYEEQE